MLIFIRVLLIVYIVSINVYSFLLIRTQKNSQEEGECGRISDGKIVVGALLGGAVGVYTAMFVFKHRLTNLFFMVFMPVIITINVYLVILCFQQNFGIVGYPEVLNAIFDSFLYI